MLENAFKGDADDIFDSSYFGDNLSIPDISLAAISSLESPKECDSDRRQLFFPSNVTDWMEGKDLNHDGDSNRSKTWRTNYANKMKNEIKSGRIRGMKDMTANIGRHVSENVSSSSTVKGGSQGRKGNKTFDSGQTSLGQGRGYANVKAKIGRHGKVSLSLEHDDSDLSGVDIENDNLNSDAQEDSDDEEW